MIVDRPSISVINKPKPICDTLWIIITIRDCLRHKLSWVWNVTFFVYNVHMSCTSLGPSFDRAVRVKVDKTHLTEVLWAPRPRDRSSCCESPGSCCQEICLQLFTKNKIQRDDKTVSFSSGHFVSFSVTECCALLCWDEGSMTASSDSHGDGFTHQWVIPVDVLG